MHTNTTFGELFLELHCAFRCSLSGTVDGDRIRLMHSVCAPTAGTSEFSSGSYHNLSQFINVLFTRDCSKVENSVTMAFFGRFARAMKQEMLGWKKDPEIMFPTTYVAGVGVAMATFGFHKLSHGWDVALHHQPFPYENIVDPDETKLGGHYWKSVHRHEIFQGLNERMSRVHE